jgi:sulfate permease, SulP family
MDKIKQFIPVISLGLLSAIDNVASGFAFAALLFPPALATGLGYGLGVILVSSIIIPLFLALRSALPNNVGMVQEEGFAILAIAIAAMLLEMTNYPPQVQIATILAALGVSTLFTGVLFLVFGYFKLGSLVRFLPFPVIAGFLAGSGWLLVDGGLIMLTSEEALFDVAHKLTETNILICVISAFAFAFTMLYSLNKWSSPLVTPMLFVVATGLFFVALEVFGISTEQAREWGWLPSIDSSASIAIPLPNEIIANADWEKVLSLTPAILSAAFVSMITLLLNTSGIELALGCERDANDELKRNGYANLLAGSFCGPSGYLCLSTTLLANKMGLASRIGGIAIGVGTIVGLFFASFMISVIPSFVPAGLMIFLGIELLLEWVLETRHKLPILEWLIVLVIVVTIASVGFVSGLALGILLSAIMFTYDYSRLNVVKLEADGGEIRSNIDRSSVQTHILNTEGESIHILGLQGYLFFGTVEKIVERVKSRINNSDKLPVQYLILDFKHVSGMDSAAATGFIKIGQAVKANSLKLYFSHLSPEFRHAIDKAGFDFEDENMVAKPDLDHALEDCEAKILRDSLGAQKDDDALANLRSFLGNTPKADDAISYLQRLELEDGSYLVRTNDDADDMFVIASGQVRVELVLSNGKALRLRTMTAGAVVGEVALCLNGKRTADIVVEGQTVVYRLAKQVLEDLEIKDPQIGFIFYRAISAALADKLILTNKMAMLAQR